MQWLDTSSKIGLKGIEIVWLASKVFTGRGQLC